jgi:hypothetical protein
VDVLELQHRIRETKRVRFPPSTWNRRTIGNAYKSMVGLILRMKKMILSTKLLPNSHKTRVSLCDQVPEPWKEPRCRNHLRIETNEANQGWSLQRSTLFLRECNSCGYTRPNRNDRMKAQKGFESKHYSRP